MADITACRTQHGWCYLAVLLGLASRRVVGWAVQRTPTADLVEAALRQALRRVSRPAASFFSTLKAESMPDQPWPDLYAATDVIGEYVDFYHHRRLHSTLDYRSPSEFERIIAPATVATNRCPPNRGNPTGTAHRFLRTWDSVPERVQGELALAL